MHADGNFLGGDMSLGLFPISMKLNLLHHHRSGTSVPLTDLFVSDQQLVED